MADVAIRQRDNASARQTLSSEPNKRILVAGASGAIGTRNLVAATIAAGVKRMVAQSIAFAYVPGLMPYREDALLNLDDPDIGSSARAVASLEQQVLTAPFEGIVLRYGKLYGPGTGFDRPPGDAPVARRCRCRCGEAGGDAWKGRGIQHC